MMKDVLGSLVGLGSEVVLCWWCEIQGLERIGMCKFNWIP